MEKREEVERTRKQRAEYEVTLTTAASPTEVKDAIKMHHPRDITEALQKAIDEVKLQGQPRLHSINKLGMRNIRLIFKTKETAKTVRGGGIDWNRAFPGLSMHKPKYGIVIHGVSNEAIDLDGEYDNTITVKTVTLGGFNLKPIFDIQKLKTHIFVSFSLDKCNPSIVKGSFRRYASGLAA